MVNEEKKYLSSVIRQIAEAACCVGIPTGDSF